jgi:hypothetical protein
MGLGREFLRDLITLRRAGELEGARRVAEIGAQQLADSLIEAPEMEEACRLFGAKKVFRVTPVGDENFTAHAPPARPFWSHLGFDHASLDVQGGTVLLDLNRGTVPEEMRGATSRRPSRITHSESPCGGAGRSILLRRSMLMLL